MINNLGAYLGGANLIAIQHQHNQYAQQAHYRRLQMLAEINDYRSTAGPMNTLASPTSCQGCGAWGVGTCEYCGNQIKRGK